MPERNFDLELSYVVPETGEEKQVVLGATSFYLMEYEEENGERTNSGSETNSATG